jgi:lauroyl/myristoyl acyltransferase
MTSIRARLTDDKFVIITVGPQAHRFVEVPFLESKARLPTGPIKLAQSTGAALLPVFAYVADDGCFEVTVNESLNSGAHAASVECMAATYAKYLAAFVHKYPEQYNGWGWILPR